MAMSLPRHVARLFAPLRASVTLCSAARSAVFANRFVSALTAASAPTAPVTVAARRFSSSAAAASASASASASAASSAPPLLSYAHGTSSVPLLGNTIGAQFDTTVAVHGDALALVSRAQVAALFDEY